MSLLVDKQIKKLIDKKEIVIDPYDEDCLSSGSYRLSLGGVILVPQNGERVVLGESINPKYDRIEIPKDGFTLKHGMFVLGQTLEKITIPKYVGGLLDTRSTLARLGVSMNNTAMYLDPGHSDSIITLEIFNSGKFDVVLNIGERVAKLIFITSNVTATRGYSEYGRYASQKETTGAKID